MMRSKVNNSASPANGDKFSPVKESSPRGGGAATEEEVWEVRPGGMLVQKRTPDSDVPIGAPVPAIRVKVKYAGVYHEIYISSQASFGELKKMLSERTGLHPEDQKLVFKDKERDSKAYLDTSGVKDRAKMVLSEDPAAKAKRLLEQRRTDKLEHAAKSISRISLDVDKLATKVTALENIVNKGGKVVEADIITLTESLMTELIKLDAIAVDGDVKAQKRMQEKRVQKYVERLDAIKLKNATPRANGHVPQPPQVHSPQAQSPQVLSPQVRARQQRRDFQPATAVTTNWEPFDLLSSMPSTSSSAITTTMAASTTSHSAVPVAPRFDWELF